MAVVIIQARMNSTRLPNKALLKIGEQSMLHHVVKQTKASRFVKDVIIATTNSPKDKKIVNFCIKNNLKYGFIEYDRLKIHDGILGYHCNHRGDRAIPAHSLSENINPAYW